MRMISFFSHFPFMSKPAKIPTLLPVESLFTEILPKFYEQFTEKSTEFIDISKGSGV